MVVPTGASTLRCSARWNPTSRAVFRTTRIATTEAGAPVIAIAMPPMMIVTCRTTSRPYGANICPAADTRRYSPPLMKLNQYETPWLMVRARTANGMVSGSKPVVMSTVSASIDPNTGSMNTNTPWTSQKMP